ncbi:MAG: AAA family ATPase [Thermosynechococcaceae cyanobacterium]
MSHEHEVVLQQLLRVIALSSGEFALLLARCNSAVVRDRLIEALRSRLGTGLFVWTATPEMGAVNVVDGLAAAPAGTQAACVTGLESSPLLNDILAIANNAREEFRKRLAFPVVVWVTDEVEVQLRRRSPDLASWAAPPFVFALDQGELQAILERETADVLDWAFLPEGKPGVAQELLGAWQEWQQSEAELAPELEARVALAFGMEAGSAEAAREALERCLTRVETGVLAAAARYRLGLWWEQQGKLNRAAFLDCCDRACEYLQQAWADPAGKHPNVALALGGVLLALALPESAGSERWEALAGFADQLERLPGFAGGLRAEVALARLDFATARREAERALQTDDRDRTGLYLLSLGRSLLSLNQAQAAIAPLEQAKALVVPEVDPDLHIRVLRALHGAYTAAKDYRRAFAVKCDRAAVETQYGFRAFMGAGRLRPQRRVGALGEATTEEIAASGRRTDIDALVERVKRNDCRLTVVHGPSGVGKSSLIQAGLVPALRKVIYQARSVVPVVIEHYEDWQSELAQKLQATLPQANSSQSPPKLGDLGLAVSGAERGQRNAVTPTDLLNQLRENDRRNLITVLIFDQFEEFFFKHPDVPGRRQFYDFLRESLNVTNVWVFLSLREDYVHYLLECDRLANLTLINNDILNKNVRYYLGNFSQERAKAVIRELTEKSPYWLEEGLIDRWVADLAAEWGEVRPIELQVVGAQMVQGEEKVLTLAAYEALGERPKQALVERWLTEVVRDCGQENEELAQRVLFALTEEPEKRPEKTKTELAREVRVQGTELTPEEQEFAVQGDLDFVVTVPVGAGLAFEIPSTVEASYQLIHDYLVPPIRRQFGDQLAQQLAEERQKRKDAEQERDEVLEQRLADEKRSNQRLRRVLMGTAVLAVGAIIAGGVATWQKQIADENTLNSRAVVDSLIWKGLMDDNVYSLEAQVTSLEKSKEWQGKLSNLHGDNRLELLATLQRAAMIPKEKNRFIGHQSSVLSVAFSPDGQRILTGSGDNTAKLWTLDGRLLQTFTGHQDSVSSVAFSPDGQRILTGSVDKTAKLWDLHLEHYLSLTCAHLHDFAQGSRNPNLPEDSRQLRERARRACEGVPLKY